MGGGGRVKTRSSLSADVRYLRQEMNAARDGSAEVLICSRAVSGDNAKVLCRYLKEICHKLCLGGDFF